MRLRELFSDDVRIDARGGEVAVTGLAVDSRAVKAGELFFALAGSKTDGARFIEQAITSGAVAVAGENLPASDRRVPHIAVANVRRALALSAARFYPRQPSVIAAVTGTSGKTSVAAFTRQIWASLSYEAASIGTIGLVTPSETTYGSLTTPDPIELARTLDCLAEDGIPHLAMEASSHGLDQHRIDGVRVTVAGFTNLSRDHMDYHATEEAYLAAKLILFERIVAPDGAAVVAADNPHADQVIAAAAGRGLRVLTAGRTGSGIRLIESAVDGFSQTLRIEHEGKGYR